MELLTCAGARVIQLDVGKPMVFTDACYQNEDVDWCCGLGGVSLDEISTTLFVLLNCLLGEGPKKQLIFEAKTLSAVLAFCLWQSELQHRLSCLFVDNEGSKYALIRGASGNVMVDCLVEEFLQKRGIVSLQELDVSSFITLQLR